MRRANLCSSQALTAMSVSVSDSLSVRGSLSGGVVADRDRRASHGELASRHPPRAPEDSAKRHPRECGVLRAPDVCCGALDLLRRGDAGAQRGARGRVGCCP